MLVSNTKHHVTRSHTHTQIHVHTHTHVYVHTHTHTLTQTCMHTHLPLWVKVMLATLRQCCSDHLRDRALLTAHDNDSMFERRHGCRVDTHQATSFAGHCLVGRLLDLGLLHRL